MHDFHFPHLCLSSIQRQAYILDVDVRCTTSETFYSVKISVAWATPLRRLIVGNAVQAPFFLLSRQTPFQLEQSFSLFPVVQLKVEPKFLIEEIVGRKDVFGQLIKECNLPNVAYKLRGFKIVLIIITNGLLLEFITLKTLKVMNSLAQGVH